jgi:hypothetical protein
MGTEVEMQRKELAEQGSCMQGIHYRHNKACVKKKRHSLKKKTFLSGLQRGF